MAYIRLIYGLIMLTAVALAQTVPPPPVIQPVQSPAVANVNVVSNAAQCLYGSNACGLSDCTCWLQLYRARCSSATSCPALTTGSPFATITAGMSGVPNGSGGTTFTMNDTDAALAPGTTWVYFETVNFANYTPFTPSAPSNSSGPVTIPAAVAASFRVALDFDNAQCVTGNTCTVQAWRGRCTTPTNCPVFPVGNYLGSAPPGFVALPAKDASGNSYTTSTVTATNTHFTYHDVGAAPNTFAYGTAYAYAVANVYVSTPTVQGGTAMLTFPAQAAPHSATLNYSSTACRSNATCTLQIYRAQCSSSTSCPTYTPGAAGWKALDMTAVSSTPTPQMTSWQYTDHDAALTGSTTYVWVATATYVGAATASAPSQPFTGTTQAGRKK